MTYSNFGYFVRISISIFIILFGIKFLVTQSNYWPLNDGPIDSSGILHWFFGMLFYVPFLAGLFILIEYSVNKLRKKANTQEAILLNVWAAFNCCFVWQFWVVPAFV